MAPCRTPTTGYTLWQKLRHQVPKSWQKMFHFISHAANPINKTEGQQFKPKLVTKQTPSTEPKVNSFNKSRYVYTGSIQCLRWPLTVYFPSGPLRAKMGCGRSDRSSKASTGFTSFEKVHTHTPTHTYTGTQKLSNPREAVWFHMYLHDNMNSMNTMNTLCPGRVQKPAFLAVWGLASE